MALPPKRRPGEVRFCDLDADVTWRAGEEPFLADEDEFAAHAGRYGYPPEVRRRVPEAARELLAAMVRRRFPFDGTAEAWWEARFGRSRRRRAPRIEAGARPACVPGGPRIPCPGPRHG